MKLVKAQLLKLFYLNKASSLHLLKSIRVVSYTPINILVLVFLFILINKYFIPNNVVIERIAITAKRIDTDKIIVAKFPETITFGKLNI